MRQAQAQEPNFAIRTLRLIDSRQLSGFLQARGKPKVICKTPSNVVHDSFFAGFFFIADDRSEPFSLADLQGPVRISMS